MDKVNSSRISNKYQIQDLSKFDYEPVYINQLNDIVDDIQNTEIEGEEVVMKTYVSQFIDLKQLLLEMVTSTPSYTPNVVLRNGKITKLSFKIDNIIANIKPCSDIDPEQKDITIDFSSYKPYHTARNALYNGLFTHENLSFYNKQNIEIEKLYTIRPISASFDMANVIVNIHYTGIDTRKAYTYDFMALEYYPVYCEFDVWQPYDKHEIEDYNQYLVRCDDKRPEILVLFPDIISRVTGYKLNRIDYTKYTILSFKRPSKLVKSNSKDLIHNLYKTVISDDHQIDMSSKKDIFNICSGLLEQKYNKKSVSRVFKNFDEAFYYQAMVGGTIRVIGNTDEDYDEIFGNNEKLYLLTKSEQKELINGFLPIKEMIYDIRSLRNYQNIKKLNDNGIRVVALKTDSLFIDNENVKKAKKIFDFSDEIGCFKVEPNKLLPTTYLRKGKSKLLNISEIKPKIHTVQNERDQNEINKIIKNSKRLLLLGNLPGVGKTHTSINFECEKKLFVCPYNKLCQEIMTKNLEAITLNVLLGLGCNDSENAKISAYDVTDYDCIVFDEIFLYDPKLLAKIQNFMNDHKEKVFIATGDDAQNTPINMYGFNNVKNSQKYLKDCINLMFENQIVLKECKRLTDKEQINKLVKFKRDILDPTTNLMDVLKQFGLKVISNMEDVKTTQNICFFNFRCNIVNKFVHSRLVTKPKETVNIQKTQYYVGLELTCKKHYRNKNIRLFKNFRYIITEIKKDTFTVIDPLANIPIILNSSVMECFTLPYANTCHSVQGLTLNEKYTIFDCNTPHANRNWVWTALTRASDMNNITIFQHKQDEVDRLIQSKKELYMKNKINGYKQQDIKAKRRIDDGSYVNLEWARMQYIEQKHVCMFCKCPFEMDIENGNVISNLTIDRLDSNKSHYTNNCVLSCLECNKGRSNK